MWKPIQIIREQIDMVAAAQEEIQRARDSLGNMLEQANRLIHLLNTHTKEDLAKLDIRDRTSTILIIKRVLTMRNFIQNIERKFQEMQMEINAFTQKFTALEEKGLPSLLTDDHRLMTHVAYVHRLNTYMDSQATTSSSFVGEKALGSGQSLYDNLENLFFIEHEVRHLFTFQPTFFRYTDADETLIKMRRHQLPDDQWWQSILEIL